MNLAANSAMRHVVLFSRTTKISLSGLGESPERFSTSCSAARRAAESAGTEELSGGPPPFVPPAARTQPARPGCPVATERALAMERPVAVKQDRG